MVVLQHATESFTTFDVAITGSSIFARLDQLIAESLMVPFGVLMLDVFTHGILQRPPSKEDHSVEELRFQTAKPSLDVRVQVGALRRQQDDFGIGVLFKVITQGNEAGVSFHD